jgi:glyoxylase-like metal-dependent hydrolase (beta-lactamase superfamily II)
VEDGGRLTVVDCGLSSFWDGVEQALAALGHSPEDVAAIVLTHGDGDHVGFAERLRGASGATVLIHSADEELATKGKIKRPEGTILPYLLNRATWAAAPEFLLGGGVRAPRVAEATTYEDGELLDVPGAPRVVHTPGHTDGHCALLFEGHDTLFAGDALCTLNVLTGRTGMQLMPRAFNVSSDAALRSLDAIEPLAATHVLVGHGEPWDRGAEQAVMAARAAGPS